MVVWLKSCLGFAKSMTSRFFSRNEALFATSFWKVHEKCQDIVVCSKSCKFWPIDDFFCFLTNWATFCNLLLKSSSKTPKHGSLFEKPSIWQLFEQKMSLHFNGLFRKKLRKLCNFSSKLPCFCIFMNFSAKSCKKCLIWWKSTRKSSIWQKLSNFLNKLPCFFWWTFKEKVGESG